MLIQSTDCTIWTLNEEAPPTGRAYQIILVSDEVRSQNKTTGDDRRTNIWESRTKQHGK